jgi:hypothetical protein
MEKSEAYELVEKETKLNSLKEEYNLIQMKKNLLQEHNEIIKEYLNIYIRIFVTIKNRLEIDPIMTDKLRIKNPKHVDSGCCLIY